jgi:c-di-GMP-related signal transduction protein
MWISRKLYDSLIKQLEIREKMEQIRTEQAEKFEQMLSICEAFKNNNDKLIAIQAKEIERLQDILTGLNALPNDSNE